MVSQWPGVRSVLSAAGGQSEDGGMHEPDSGIYAWEW